MAEPVAALPDCRIVVVLGGGNALGAYHAGLYQALHDRGIEPDWIVGTSIGAVNGAIIAGNPPERRIERLQQFWRPAEAALHWPMPWDMVPDSWRRTGAAMATLLGGRPGLFGPLGSRAIAHDQADASPALYDTAMLKDTLDNLVDFARLNQQRPRFTACAVDIETGDDIWIDTAQQTLTADHIRASAALLTTFPAVEVDGRLLGDGGLSANLPLDPVMADAGTRPTLCIAADLLPLTGRRPQSLGEVISRMQDLTFAAQSRRTIARWQQHFRYPSTEMSLSSVTLVRLAYSDQGREVAGKAMDFSPTSVRGRWDAGLDDGNRLTERLHAGDIAVGEPGLSIPNM